MLTTICFLAILLAWTTPTESFSPNHCSSRTLTDLQSSTDPHESPKQDVIIRYLGRGDRAIVREGCVLVAPNHEYNHFLMRSVVFVHAIGINEYGEDVARGVIIDHPTAFTMGEMGGGSVSGVLAENILYRGGDNGNDAAMLLHSVGSSVSTKKTEGDDTCDEKAYDIACGEEIGTSGIYEGGIRDAMNLVDQAIVNAEKFKFFFNYVEFTDKELEGMLSATDSDGDAWVSLEVPSGFVLKDYGDRGDA